MAIRLPTNLALAALLLSLSLPASAQNTGTVQGTVTRSDNDARVFGANVSVQGTGLEALSGADGRYTLQRVPVGEHTLLVRWVGYRPQEVKVSVTAGSPVITDV